MHIFACSVRKFLNAYYLQWTGRGGIVAWPPQSPDLTPLEVYLWGYMLQKVNAVVIESREQFLERIDIAAENIRQNNLEIQRFAQSVSFRAQACLQSGRNILKI